MKKKIAFVTLGCKLNYAETSTYERRLVETGLFETVQWEEQADMYLVNTCTVTEHSDKKCRNIIRKLHRVSPDAEIIVTGCYAQMKKAEIEKIEGVRFVFGADEFLSVRGLHLVQQDEFPSVPSGRCETGIGSGRSTVESIVCGQSDFRTLVHRRLFGKEILTSGNCPGRYDRNCI